MNVTNYVMIELFQRLSHNFTCLLAYWLAQVPFPGDSGWKAELGVLEFRAVLVVFNVCKTRLGYRVTFRVFSALCNFSEERISFQQRVLSLGFITFSARKSILRA